MEMFSNIEGRQSGAASWMAYNWSGGQQSYRCKIVSFSRKKVGNSLAVPWLGLRASNSGVPGSIPGREQESCKPGGATKKKQAWFILKCTCVKLSVSRGTALGYQSVSNVKIWLRISL